MKKISLIICLLLCCITSNCQIVTPSFTNYSSCPTYYSQVELCVGWRQPTGGTSDYFNACAASTAVGIPQNAFGYQTCSDSAYTGLYTYLAGLDYREYIGTMIAPLTVGHTYTMTLTVSLADSSRFATEGLGVFFSTYEVHFPLLRGALNVIPQVDYSSYGFISDKVNWTTLSKEFVADSAYTNIVVGCFKSDIAIHKDSLKDGLIQGQMASYYYINRIGIPGVVPIDTAIPSNITNYGFPDAFTPNGDGKNEVFRIITKRGTVLDEYSLRIFNRFGELVFFTENPVDGWNGIFNSVPQQIGAYYYMARFKVNGKEKLLKGNVTLIR